VTPNRHGSAVIEFPNELEIVTTREFDAPIELVFDVFTKPEHVSKWFAPFTCEVTECSIDLRVGGNYHIVFVTDDGTECSSVAPTWRSSRPPGPSQRGCSKDGQLRTPSSPWICTKLTE
jgi:Activator of Hsp90 ATPase homolog 1-like protein